MSEQDPNLPNPDEPDEPNNPDNGWGSLESWPPSGDSSTPAERVGKPDSVEPLLSPARETIITGYVDHLRHLHTEFGARMGLDEGAASELDFHVNRSWVNQGNILDNLARQGEDVDGARIALDTITLGATTGRKRSDAQVESLRHSPLLNETQVADITELASNAFSLREHGVEAGKISDSLGEALAQRFSSMSRAPIQNEKAYKAALLGLSVGVGLHDAYQSSNMPALINVLTVRG